MAIYARNNSGEPITIENGRRIMYQLLFNRHDTGERDRAWVKILPEERLYLTSRHWVAEHVGYPVIPFEELK